MSEQTRTNALKLAVHIADRIQDNNIELIMERAKKFDSYMTGQWPEGTISTEVVVKKRRGRPPRRDKATAPR